MTDAAAVRQPTELHRAIGRKMLLFFVIGDILGAGIYALVGEVGGRVGGAIWAAFALALALAVYGFYTSLAGQPLLGGRLLED